MNEHPGITVEQMSQAWDDIRGYTSSMWQVSALCLTIVTLSVNVFLTSMQIEFSLASIAWLPILIFAFCFVAITLYTIQYLRKATVKRVIFLLKVEEKLQESAPGSTVPLRHIYGVDWGPLGVLLYFFYGLAIALLAMIGIVSTYLVFSVHVLFSVLTIAASAITGFVVFGPLYGQYQAILERENDAWTLSDDRWFDWDGEHFPVLKDISLYLIGVLKEAARGRRVNLTNKVRRYVGESHGSDLSHATVRYLLSENGPIHKLGLDPRIRTWRECDKKDAIEDLDKIAEKISELEVMPD